MGHQKIMINKDDSRPLYYQLKEILKNDILSGKLKSGEAILSERELIEYYDISRTPVRQAISELVTEGLLVKQHGKGTFVAERKKTQQWFLESLTSFEDEMSKKGLNYGTKVLEHKTIIAHEKLSAIFQHKYKTFHYIKRLRYIKNVPYVLVDTFIPYELAPKLSDVNLGQQSLYKTLETTYQFDISYALRDIESIVMNKDQANILQTDEYNPAHLITTTTFLKQDIPFEYSIGCYRGDLNKFSVKVAVKT